MGSQTKTKIPVIDLCRENIKPGTITWLSTSKDIQRALEEYGVFTAKFEKLPIELHDEMFESFKELFDLPLETKERNTSDKLGFGYRGNFPFMLIEYFGIENSATVEATQSFSKLMWPTGNENFCETTVCYSNMILELGHLVMRMVFEGYGAEKYYESHINSITYLMRLMKYKGPEGNDEQVGLLPHTDKNFWAILDQNQVKGLEIQAKDGEWIYYEPEPSSFIVIAGEPFMAWSNDRVHAPLHRVIMSGNETKYTMGMFAFVGETVKTPEELVDEEHPLHYKSFDQFEFLKYCGGDGLKLSYPIKSYCGV